LCADHIKVRGREVRHAGAALTKMRLKSVAIVDADIVGGSENHRAQLHRPLAVIVRDGVNALVNAELMAVGAVARIAQLESNVYGIESVQLQIIEDVGGSR